MSWLASHLGLISTGISVCTLIVWIFYAQLLFLGFRRNEQPLILIHQARAGGHGSFCIVANLSRQPLHVVTVDLTLITRDNGQIKLRLNDYTRITSDDESEWAVEDVMKEGPLRAGDFLSLGGFNSMLQASGYARSEDEDKDERAASQETLADQACELEIRVTALFSAFTNPIGASRRFSVTRRDGRIMLDPKTPLTRQMNSLFQRRRVYRWLSRRQTHYAQHGGGADRSRSG